MAGYKSISSKEEFDKFVKGLISAKQGKVQELELEPMQFLSVKGGGAPASEPFQQAIGALYSVAYTLKMGMKYDKMPKPAGYFDYRVAPLDGLWQISTIKDGDLSNAKWQLMILQPAFITEKMLKDAAAQAAVKKPNELLKDVELITFNEGRVIQTLHIGPYDKEQPAIDLLKKYCTDNGLEVTGTHHEIYLNDPRRAGPDKTKTILRTPVKPA
jgi:hypothetical protein